MTDFSLTHPTPASGKRDPNVFPPQPGRDYEQVAVTSWLNAQHGALDMDDIEQAIQNTDERLANARAWFEQHDTTHLAYERAYRLRLDLERRKHSQLLQLRVVAYACWVACCEVYAALCHVDRAGWIRTYAARRFTGTTPQGIWAAIRGKQPAPGAWPAEDTEAWVERRLGSVEVWNMNELRERLQERQIVEGE